MKLRKTYKGLGECDEELKAETFYKVMTDYVHQSLARQEGPPHGLDSSGGRMSNGFNIMDCMKQRSPGIILEFYYKGKKVSVDIVNLIPLKFSWLQEILLIFPGYDEKKMNFLKKHKLFSESHDGVIVKDVNWRLSFSRSEAKMLEAMDGDTYIYKTIKYLANISGQTISSYFLKVDTLD